MHKKYGPSLREGKVLNIAVIAISIFFARIADVSLGTLRLKAVIRGRKGIAFMLAFAEVVIYTLAAANAYKYISNIAVLLMFSFGYASGNYIGIILDEKMSKSSVMAIIITDHDEWQLADILREKGYGVTTSKSYGLNGIQKAQLKLIVPKEKLRDVQNIVSNYDESAYMVEVDVTGVNKMPVRK